MQETHLNAYITELEDAKRAEAAAHAKVEELEAVIAERQAADNPVEAPAPEEHVEVAQEYTRKELEKMAGDLGITDAKDKKKFPNKGTLVEAIEVVEAGAPPNPVSEPEAPVDEPEPTVDEPAPVV